MAAVVPVSQEERVRGQLSASTLACLRADLRAHGWCLLGRGIISESALDTLGRDLDLICAGLAASQILDRPEAERSWHMGAGVPRCSPYMHEDFVANPLIEHAISELLGPGAFMSFCNANTNATCSSSGARADGSDTQALHGDGRWAFATPAQAKEAGDPRWPHDATQVVVNFSNADVGKWNGATEIWPGSHAVQEVAALENQAGKAGEGGAATIQELADLRRESVPPVAAAIPRGGVLIRDARLWHRGIHNPDKQPRHMVAVCYSAASVRDRCVVNSTRLRMPGEDESKLRCQGGFCPPLSRLRFSDSCATMFASSPSLHGVDRNVELVPGTVDNWGRSVVRTVAVAPSLSRYPSTTIDVSSQVWEYSAQPNYGCVYR